MKFKPTYLRNNKIRITANIADKTEFKAEILNASGQPIGVPLYQTPFNDLAEFRLEAILRSQPFYAELPNHISGITIVKNYAQTYQLKYQRADGAGSPTTVSNITVQAGGVPDYVFNKIGNPISRVNPLAHRLTYQPRLKRISKTQPEFLFFFNNTDPAVTRINVSATIRFDDNSVLTQALPSASVSAFDLAVINVSPTILEPFAFGRQIISYDISIADQLGSKLFDTHSYVIDSRYHQNEVFLIYQNSFGCWDTLRCFGDHAETQAVTRSFAENETGRRLFHASGRRTVTLNTGHQEQGIKEALPEILFSPKIYRFDGLNSEQLNLLTADLEAFSTNPDNGVELEFEYITEDLAYAI